MMRSGSVGHSTFRWAAAALFASATPAASQVAQGVLRDSTAGTPLPGAVVMALDSVGATIARTLTDSAGRFSIAFGRSDRLRFVRIGYTPREARVDAFEARAWTIAMVRIPPVLNAVRVAERGVCPGAGVSDGAVAWRTWDQARAGLLASVVARTTNPMTASSLLFNRRVSAFDHLVRRQTTHQRDGTVERPFTAAAPSRFVSLGYFDEDSTGRTFHGPDADVLLHESFAATHCFELRDADAAHRGQVGLAFKPTPERDTMVDVAGVIWFSGDGSALRSLEFRYTGLEPAAVKAEVGGEIDFRSLPNGAVFVDRWSLRVPVMSAVVGAARPPSIPPRGKSQRMVNASVRVAEIEEVGGVVTTASWRDGTKWSSPITGLSGVVREAGVDSPVPGAIVALEGASQHVLTDRDGEFMFSLLPGRYTLSVIDTSLQRFASPRRTSQTIEVEQGQLVRVSPRVESQVGAVADACKGHQNPRNARVISGLIGRASGAAPARVRAAWRLASGDSAHSETQVDDRGRFLLCGPTSESRVSLRVRTGQLESDTTVDVGFTLITTVDWKPTLRPQVAGPDTRVVSGVVTDSGFRPVTRVSVSAAGHLSVSTDDEGRFRLRLDTRSAAVLDVRRIGFAPARFGLGEGGDTTVAISLLPSTQLLETVNVRATSASAARLRGFEERLERRTRGAIFGTFITADQIERRSPVQLTQMLTNISGIYIEKVHPSFPRYAIFGRSSNGGKCPATVFLDGIRLMQGGDAVMVNGQWVGQEQGVAINDLLSPQLVGGIEVYRTGFDAPPQFYSTTGDCAVVVIWSKAAEKP
jgi:hypothetical protein